MPINRGIILKPMDKLKTTNSLLLILVIPLIFYLAKTLSFIFIPLIFSMFIALLFLPLMRWLKKRGIKQVFSILIVVAIIVGMVTIGVQLFKLSTKQI